MSSLDLKESKLAVCSFVDVTRTGPCFDSNHRCTRDIWKDSHCTLHHKDLKRTRVVCQYIDEKRTADPNGYFDMNNRCTLNVWKDNYCPIHHKLLVL